MAGVKGRSGGARPNSGGRREGAGRPRKKGATLPTTAASGSAPAPFYADAETLRAGIARRTLRMTGLADRLREAAGT